ncbi:MAG TPA: basic secretory protein-like protein [Vicinamibacterales bacterium]|nr:basic secretory protein-like protein [Vicinamibacterales bacterium]
MQPLTPARLRLAAMIAFIILSGADWAMAQQFGRNQVRHRSFQFRVLRTEHFAIYYYEDATDAARVAGRMAERWRTRLSGVLGHDLQGEQPLILYAAPGHFQQTNVADVSVGEGVGGFIESLRRRIVMPFVGDFGETDHVLGHEMVHAFQFDMIGTRWPLWFMEGMAEYLSLGSVDAQTALWMRDAALRDRLPTISDLNNPRFFPYRYGQALFAYIGQRYGDRAIAAIMRRLGAPATRPLEGAPAETRNAAGHFETVGDPIKAIELALGVDRETLSRQWQESIRATMLPPVQGHDVQPGDTLIDPRTESEMNVGPVLSPDGSRVAFLTSRNRLSIDLAVADANTGRIQRTLLRTAGDLHLDSLQFIHSAGTWDPSGHRVAVAVMRRGRPVLAIVNADTGRRERDIPLPGVDEAIQPAWSPDGKQIAFSGLRNGMSDLYLISVDEGAIRRLTEDPFAERQPAWSPDGRSLVFVTDRFSSSIDALQLGAHEMARIDVTTREVARLSGFAGAQHGSPQWTEHGIYFVANPDGVPDVYRLDPATGGTTRITRSSTGVTGITSSSPALSVSRMEQRLAFSLRRYSYEIRQLKGSGLTAGEPARSETTLAAARLAPASGSTSIDRLLANAAQGLSTGRFAESVPFRPRLGLDFIGQEFGVSTGGTGPFLSGGIGFLFSDMLSNHVLEAMVQSNSEFRDTGGRIGYMNRGGRWNWGGFVQHVPVVTGGISRAIAEINGQPVSIEQEVRDRQLGQQVQGVLEFPISRSQRFEFGTGVSHFTFNRRIRTEAFSPSGALVAQDEQHVEIADPLTLWQSTAAFVTDTAVLGPTAPLLGHRSRFEVAPTVGEVDYTSLVLDVRRYVMPFQPFTIAARAVHVGRYGGDADSGRLSPLFVGFPTFVRGYDVYSFHAHDCDPGACIQIDDLEGSRLLVANVEVRTPLVGMFKGRIDYGHVPVDLIGFYDTGIAWHGSNDEPSSSFNDRPWVKSAGAGLRFNAFGFAVFEMSAVHAFDRPRDKWQFLFALQPGF